jgi:replicative DNA helicase
MQAVLNSPEKVFAIFSAEMPAKSLVLRMLANAGQINFSNLRQGTLSKAEISQLQNTAGRIRHRQITIEDTQPIDAAAIATKCRLRKQQYGLCAIVVDYLQLVTPARAAKRDSSREREVAEISRSLKTLALELGITVIALSQLNDTGQLRESRAIGQDADIVLRIVQEQSGTQIVVQKHRNGPCLAIPVIFDGARMRFSEVGPKKSQPEPNLGLSRNGGSV